MRTIQHAGALILTALLALPNALVADDWGDRRGPATGHVAFQYVGRVSLDFTTLKGVVYGYLTVLDGANASIFQGGDAAASETTAFLTFRADITFQPLPGNGDPGDGTRVVMPVLIQPGDFSIYYTSTPSRDWGNAGTFSNGKIVATFSRQVEQTTLFGPTFSSVASSTLRSSTSFSLNGHNYLSFRELIPDGITDMAAGPNIPLKGSTPTNPIYAFAGYALAIRD